MLYDLGKKLFKYLLNSLRFLQVALIFLAFFIILYWLLELGKSTFIEPFTPFFEAIKSFVHLFYKRTVSVDEVTIDFSFLIASFLSLIIAWGLKFVIELAQTAEREYDKIYNYFRKRTEKLLNIALEQEYLLHEYRNNKFLIMIRFNALNLARDSFFHRDANVGLAEKEKEILLRFGEELDKKIESQKRFLNDGLLLYFNSFKQVDNVILEIDDIISDLRRHYYEDKWQVSTCIGIDAYAQDKEILDKIRELIMLIRLGITDKIVCLSTFKQRYSLIKNKKYLIETQGVYKMNEVEENVFVLKG